MTEPHFVFSEKLSMFAMQMEVSMKCCWLLIASLILFSPLFGQDANRSKMKEADVFTKMEKSEKELNLYTRINLANELISRNPDQALSEIEDVLNLAFESKDRRAQAYCHNSLGAINYQLNRYEVAIEQYEKAIRLFEKEDDGQGLYNSHKYLAMALDGAGRDKAALKAYAYFLELAQAQNNTQDISDTQNRMARIYYNQGNFREAMNRYQNVLDIQKEAQLVPGMIETLNLIGNTCNSLGNSEEALNYYEQAANLAEQTNNDQWAPNSYEQISQVYKQRGDVENELNTRKKSYQSAKKFNRRQDEAQEAVNIGNIYLEQNNSEAAIPYFKQTIDLNDELGAIEELDLSADTIRLSNSSGYAYNNGGFDDFREFKSIDRNGNALADNSSDLSTSVPSNTAPTWTAPHSGWTSPNAGNRAADEVETTKNLPDKKQALETQARAYEGLGKAYRAQGDYKDAYDNLLEAKQLEAQLLETQIAELNQARDEALRIQQKSDLIYNRAKLRESRLDRQKLINYSLLAFIAVLLISAIFILRSNKERQRANQLLALKSLRSQMNPHFIFNSLNSINSFIAKNDERSANKYLADFSRLMRAVMENSQEDFVPFSTESQVLELYLGLEHVRFQDLFNYEYIVDPAIDRDSMEIPPMLIQPYIENAIWHGLRYKKEKGHLKVSILPEDESLLVLIEDNGIGRKKSQELKTKNQKAQRSTGLKNTEARLKLINRLYKQNLKVQIGDLNPEAEDVGTRVEIRLPMRKLEA